MTRNWRQDLTGIIFGRLTVVSEQDAANGLTHDGRTLNVTQWAKLIGISKATLLEALKKHPVEIALRNRAKTVAEK